MIKNSQEEIENNLKRIIYECEENLKKLESCKSANNSSDKVATSSSHS